MKKTLWFLGAWASVGFFGGLLGLSGVAWAENYKTWDARSGQWVEASGTPAAPAQPVSTGSGNDAPATYPVVRCVPVAWSPQLQCYRGSVPAYAAPAPQPAPKWQVTIVTNEWHYCSGLNNVLFGTQAPYGCYYAQPSYGAAYIGIYGHIGGHHHP
jgi:hypothetical protein